MESSKKREFLTETPVPQLILKLSVPTIISMLVTAFYNSADTYFVGKISTEATAAVGLVFSVMAIIQAIGFFCGHGAGNYLSRMLGAGKMKEANEMASTGFALALILGTIVALLGNIFANPIAFMLGADDTMMTETVSYMRVIMLGAPLMMGQFVLNNELRFQGSAIYAMIGLMCGAVINVGLDPLLILYFGMGVTGAAIATVSGQLISFIVLLIGSSRGENIHIHIKNIHLNSYYLLQIVNGGAPSLLRQGMAAIATLLMNSLASNLGGAATIAGMSIVSRVMLMMSSALIGFGQGYQPVCSFNYGAGLTHRVKEGYIFCVKWGTIFLAFLAVLAFVFAPDIIWWFRNDQAVVEVGKVALRWQCCVLPLSAFLIMSNMMMQSMGHGVRASIAASCRNGICFIPMVLILSYTLGLFGLEIAQTCADVLTMFIIVPMAVKELKSLA